MIHVLHVFTNRERSTCDGKTKLESFVLAALQTEAPSESAGGLAWSRADVSVLPVPSAEFGPPRDRLTYEASALLRTDLAFLCGSEPPGRWWTAWLLLWFLWFFFKEDGAVLCGWHTAGNFSWWTWRGRLTMRGFLLIVTVIFTARRCGEVLFRGDIWAEIWQCVRRGKLGSFFWLKNSYLSKVKSKVVYLTGPTEAHS